MRERNNSDKMYLQVITLFFIVLFDESYGRNGVIKFGIKHYTNTWLVKISGGSEKAREIAEKENFTILEEVSIFCNHFEIFMFFFSFCFLFAFCKH